MKDILGTIGKILGLCFAALVIGYTAYLTYLLAARLVPDNTILQAMTVVLFDGGALIWFTLFLTQAKGTAQWAIAGIGFAVGLVGAVIMAGGELILGQSLITLEDTTQIGWILIATTIGAALAHASLTYAFHFADPGTHNRIENAQKISKVTEQAYQNARAEIDRQAEEMGRDLASSLIYQARAELSAAALPHLRRGSQIETATAEGVRGVEVIPGTLHNAGTAAPVRRPMMTRTPGAGLRWPWDNKQQQAQTTPKASPAAHTAFDPSTLTDDQAAALMAFLQARMMTPRPAAPGSNGNGHRVYSAETPIPVDLSAKPGPKADQTVTNPPGGDVLHWRERTPGFYDLDPEFHPAAQDTDPKNGVSQGESQA